MGETWSLILREEHNLRVFKNTMLREGLDRRGMKRLEIGRNLITRGCIVSIIRIIKSRRMRWAGHLARMEGKRNVYMGLVGKREGKRPLGRPRRRWIDNIKMMESVEVDWIGLAQDRYRWRTLVNSVMNLRVP
jgi:hypothetical protein